jgi:hypothetical protein
MESHSFVIKNAYGVHSVLLFKEITRDWKLYIQRSQILIPIPIQQQHMAPPIHVLFIVRAVSHTSYNYHQQLHDLFSFVFTQAIKLNCCQPTMGFFYRCVALLSNRVTVSATGHSVYS